VSSQRAWTSWLTQQARFESRCADDSAILALITESFKGSPFEDIKLEFGKAVSSKWSMSILLDRKDTMVTIELKGTKGNPKASFDVSDPDFHIEMRSTLDSMTRIWLYTGFINRSIRKLSYSCDERTIDRLRQAVDLIKNFGITNKTMDKRIKKLDNRLEGLK
jgi:hypothetical protein